MISAAGHLRACVERAVKQQGSEFAGDYGRYGFWTNPFSGFDYPLSSNYEQLFIGRSGEIEELSKRFVGSFLGKGEDTAVVGAEGIGARSLVNLLKNYAYELETEEETYVNSSLKDKLFEIFDIKAKSVNDDLLYQLKEKTEIATKQKKMLLVASSFDEKDGLLGSDGRPSGLKAMFRRLLEVDRVSHDKAIFITPWTASACSFMLEQEYSAMDIYEKFVFLDRLSEHETEELIKSRVGVFKRPEKARTELLGLESIKALSSFSGGIPKFALKFSGIVLGEAIASRKASPLTTKYVESVLQQSGYMPYSETAEVLRKLIPKHPWESKHGKTRTEMKILRSAALLGKEATSTEIGKVVGKSRVAVLENLKKLEKAKIICYLSRREGGDSRRRPFVLNDFAKSVFENEFLVPEIKRNVKKEVL